MKLESQVCTKQQADRLKELGVTQDSLFSFFKAPSHAGICLTDMRVRHVWILSGSPYDEEDIEFAATFTVAELGVVLKDWGLPIYWKLWNEWCFKVGDQPQGYGTEAVARAALLIHLLEKGSITADEVNQRLQNA